LPCEIQAMFPSRAESAPVYPATVTIGGIAWILFGTVILLNLVALLLRSFSVAAKGHTGVAPTDVSRGFRPACSASRCAAYFASARSGSDHGPK
jgi:hypothetical protein